MTSRKADQLGDTTAQALDMRQYGPTAPQLATAQGGDPGQAWRWPGCPGKPEGHAVLRAGEELPAGSRQDRSAQAREETAQAGEGPPSTGERTVPAHTRVNQEQEAQGTEGPTGSCQCTEGVEWLGLSCEWLRHLHSGETRVCESVCVLPSIVSVSGKGI